MAQRLVDAVTDLHRRTAEQAGRVRRLVDRTVEVLADPDVVRAGGIAVEDDRIDAEEVKIEESAVRLLALHQPAAADLRYVAALLKVNVEMERAADCATAVAERVAGLAARGGYRVPADLLVLARSAARAFGDAVDLLDRPEPELARRVIRGDDVLDALHVQVARDMTTAIELGADPGEGLGNVMMAKELERIGDHAVHIAREVLYVRTGAVTRHQPDE